MPRLYNKHTGSLLGSLSESDLQLLVDQLEEEHQSDDDYFVDGPTIDVLEENGASAALVAMLRTAIDGGEGIDIIWKA